MKKLLILTVVLFFVLLANSFSQETSEDKASNFLKLERDSEGLSVSETQPYSEPLDIEKILDIANGPTNKEDISVLFDPWYSTDPNDLAPMRGTKWSFSYTLISEWTQTITFGSIMRNYGGAVALKAWDEYGSPGILIYADLQKGVRGFYAIIDGGRFIDYYNFNISGKNATGSLFYKDTSNDYVSDLHPMTGIKIETPSYICPFKTTLNNTEYINTLHLLRDKRFNNFYGKLLTSIFYRNAEEVNSILIAHPELQTKLRELVDKNIEIAENFIQKGRANLPLRNADEIIAFLNEIAKDGSLRLKFYTTLVINGIEYRFLMNGIGLNIN